MDNVNDSDCIVEFNVDVGVKHTIFFQYSTSNRVGKGGGVFDKAKAFNCLSVPALLSRIVVFAIHVTLQLRLSGVQLRH